MNLLKRFLRAVLDYFAQRPTGCPMCGGAWTGPDTFQLVTCSRCGYRQPTRPNV